MITINGLTKAYGSNTILRDLNVCFPENEISFIMGENGAGKTTLLKCLLNLENYKGQISFNQKNIKDVRNKIYVVYDDSPLYLNLNGYRNIEILLNSNIKKAKIKEVALSFLNEDTLKSKVKGYSYGQRKKLSLIIAALNQPQYLFMDEVSNGLDYETMQDLKITLKKWSQNTTIIATGHQFDFYAPIIDNLFIMKNGKLNRMDFKEERGDLGEIYQKFAK